MEIRSGSGSGSGAQGSPRRVHLRAPRLVHLKTSQAVELTEVLQVFPALEVLMGANLRVSSPPPPDTAPLRALHLHLRDSVPLSGLLRPFLLGPTRRLRELRELRVEGAKLCAPMPTLLVDLLRAQPHLETLLLQLHLSRREEEEEVPAAAAATCDVESVTAHHPLRVLHLLVNNTDGSSPPPPLLRTLLECGPSPTCLEELHLSNYQEALDLAPLLTVCRRTLRRLDIRLSHRLSVSLSPGAALPPQAWREGVVTLVGSSRDFLPPLLPRTGCVV